MAKKGSVEEMPEVSPDLVLDTEDTTKSVPIKLDKPTPVARVQEEDTPVHEDPSALISCLRNEIVHVRYLKRESGLISNPNHVFYGGMGESSVRVFTVPMLESNGQYVNILTNDEKKFLEEYMGLSFNALSIYRKDDNYWDNYQVRLTKSDTPLNLSDPNDYIKYKVLLANKDFIAPSLQSMQDVPKQTYQFVIVSDAEENKSTKIKLNSTMEAYKEFGKYEDNFDVLKFVVESIGGRLIAANSKIDHLHGQVDKMIKADPKMFVSTITDPYLDTKVLIKRGIDGGIIASRGDYLYLKSDNTPLCEVGENPTLSMAAKFLNSPKRQDIKFLIEAQLNK